MYVFFPYKSGMIRDYQEYWQTTLLLLWFFFFTKVLLGNYNERLGI